jgi:predicted DNA-binding protein YlxM (UPF0122 family)
MCNSEKIRGNEVIQFKPKSHILFCVSAHQSGMTFQEIADIFSVSRQAVEQIILGSGYEIRENIGGNKVQSFLDGVERIKLRNEHQEKVAQLKWGCSHNQVNEVKAKGGGNTSFKNSAICKFKQQRASAQMRRIGWELSLWDWWTIWQESGKYEQRGRGNGYCMARFGDTGPYSKSNVYITTSKQNSSDQYISGKDRAGKKVSFPNAGKENYGETIFIDL